MTRRDMKAIDKANISPGWLDRYLTELAEHGDDERWKWKLAPVEPTPEVLAALGDFSFTNHIWRKALAAAREVFEEVDEALGQRLSKLMRDGPEADLTLTANAQPAIMAASIAIVRSAEAELGHPLMTHAGFVAGHSLGEWSALAATSALSLTDAARLLRLRGQAMQEAVAVGEGAMTALLGVDVDVAAAIAAEAAAGEVCAVANDNAPGQVVLSGTTAAILRAEALGPAKGVKRCIRLAVSAPFHCALMAPAVPVVANATALPVDQPSTIRRLLVDQVTQTVRWRESMLRLKSLGVDTVVELGQGKVLSGLVKRIDRELAAQGVATPAEIDALLKSL